MGFAGKQIGERGSEVVEIRESDTGPRPPMEASKMLCNLSSLCEVTLRRASIVAGMSLVSTPNHNLGSSHGAEMCQDDRSVWRIRPVD